MRIVLLMVILAASMSVLGQTPAAVERTMIGHLDAIGKYGTYGGVYDEKKNDAANARLRAALIKFGSRADILKYGFPKLKRKMFIATSPDGRFRAYSWDMETGGTMHDFDTVYQFRGKSGKVGTWAARSGDDDYGGGFFTDVFQVGAAGGPIYLAVSNFIASSSLAGQSLSAYRIDADKLVIEPKVIRTASGLTGTVGFAFDFFSVVDHPERPVKLFFYDANKKEFRFPVVIEDPDVPQGRVTDKLIRYRFDGKYFVKVG